MLTNTPGSRLWPASRSLLMAALAAVMALSGCAFSPGLYFGKSKSIFGADTPIVAVGPATAGAPAADPPPPGALIAITPELVGQQRAARQRAEIPADVKALFATPEDYRIGPGDTLNIVVWDHPQLALPAAGGLATDAGSLANVGNGYNVSPRGLIQFPYIGAIKLSDLTEYEARDRIAQRLSRFIKNAQVTVRVQSYRSGRIYVDGEVATPGVYVLNDVPMTLTEALGRAGGTKNSSNRAGVTITRKGVTTEVNLPQLVRRGINPAEILLLNGDMVRVPAREDAKVFVMGEVLRPVTATLNSDGRLTLYEALGGSSGLSGTTGDPKQIFVIRPSRPEQPELYHLDASTATAYALAEGFELQARDVVYVDPVPLVLWNRVINLILPSASAVVTTQGIVN